ncbi:hypothetical protein [Alteribacter aurantiacus]|uniref:hypothetical protein n=1 Tax=Alteribacter aurantiacus TaxID=254410 RepID=UPI00041FA276|nr:hypothetical protein [Alteribacter aurantiacus]
MKGKWRVTVMMMVLLLAVLFLYSQSQVGSEVRTTKGESTDGTFTVIYTLEPSPNPKKFMKAALFWEPQQGKITALHFLNNGKKQTTLNENEVIYMLESGERKEFASMGFAPTEDEVFEVWIEWENKQGKYKDIFPLK